MNGMLVGPYAPTFGAPPLMGNQGMGMYLQHQQDQQARPNWGQPVPTTGASPILWGEQSHGLGQQQLEPLNEMFLPSSDERVSRPPTPRAQIATVVVLSALTVDLLSYVAGMTTAAGGAVGGAAAAAAAAAAPAVPAAPAAPAGNDDLQIVLWG